MRAVETAERSPIDTARRQRGLIVTFAGCGHKHFLGAPETKPSEMLGAIRECGVFPCYNPERRRAL